MSPSSRIKQFIRAEFRKIKLAVAFYIIIHTPPGKTAEEYAKELQEAFIKVLRDKNDPKLCKLLALRQQEEAVASQLSSVIPDLTDLSQRIASSLGTDSGYGSCDIDAEASKIAGGVDSHVLSAFAEYETPLNFSEDVPQTLSANLDFVRGLIRLQDLVRKEDEVSDLHREGAVSDLSVSNTQVPVPKGVIQYALQASNVEVTVRKSVQVILRELCGIALIGTELPYAICNWEGSLLQHSVAIIRKLSDDKSYQQGIVQATGHVATILIADMLKNYDLEKNMKFEYQVILVLQICGSMATCLEVLNILVSNINMIMGMSVAITKSESESPVAPTEQTIHFEGCFFIFHLTEKLLQRYFALQEIDKSQNVDPNRGSKDTKVTQLWRCAWGKRAQSETYLGKEVLTKEDSDTPKLLQSWSTILKTAAQLFSIHYPLLAIYASNCLNLITHYQQKE